MPRGATLATVRTLFKSLVGEVNEDNTAQDTFFNARLKAVQDELCSSFDWPFMSDRWEQSLSAGDRYKAFPTSNVRAINSTINRERPLKVSVYYNSRYHDILYGIDIEHYNWHNSALNEANDPIQRWAEDTNTGDASNADEFEVWPIPVTSQTIRFEGQRKPRAFTADSDKAELDDLLIALFAAAEHMATRDQKSAAIILQRANRKMVSCRAGIPGKNDRIVLGQSELQFPKQKLIHVAVAS